MNLIPSALIDAALQIAGKNHLSLDYVVIEPNPQGAIIFSTDHQRMFIARTYITWDLGQLLIPRSVAAKIAKLKGVVEFGRAAIEGHYRASAGGMVIEFKGLLNMPPAWRFVVACPVTSAVSGFDPVMLEGVAKSAGIISKAFGGDSCALSIAANGNQLAMMVVGDITDPDIKSVTYQVMPKRDCSHEGLFSVGAIKA